MVEGSVPAIPPEDYLIPQRSVQYVWELSRTTSPATSLILRLPTTADVFGYFHQRANHIDTHSFIYLLYILIHGVVHGHAPEYVVDMVVPVSHLPGRSHLRSAQRGHFDIPRSRTAFGSRSFSTAAPLVHWSGSNYSLTSATSRQLLHSRNTSRHYCLMLPMAPHSCDTPIVFYLAFYN